MHHRVDFVFKCTKNPPTTRPTVLARSCAEIILQAIVIQKEDQGGDKRLMEEGTDGEKRESRRKTRNDGRWKIFKGRDSMVGERRRKGWESKILHVLLGPALQSETAIFVAEVFHRCLMAQSENRLLGNTPDEKLRHCLVSGPQFCRPLQARIFR
jgi:hypothetical protein